MPKTKSKKGRPSDYTKETGDLICNRIAEGNSLRSICLADDMPSKTSVFRWLREYPLFRDQYEISMEERTTAMAEETMEIADESLSLAREVDPKASGAVVQAQRLRVDTRKWMMSKMKPKKYGDKVDLTSGGEKLKGNTIIFKDFKDDSSNSQ